MIFLHFLCDLTLKAVSISFLIINTEFFAILFVSLRGGMLL